MIMTTLLDYIFQMVRYFTGLKNNRNYAVFPWHGPARLLDFGR